MFLSRLLAVYHISIFHSSSFLFAPVITTPTLQEIQNHSTSVTHILTLLLFAQFSSFECQGYAEQQTDQARINTASTGDVHWQRP